ISGGTELQGVAGVLFELLQQVLRDGEGVVGDHPHDLPTLLAGVGTGLTADQRAPGHGQHDGAAGQGTARGPASPAGPAGGLTARLARARAPAPPAGGARVLRRWGLRAWGAGGPAPAAGAAAGGARP